MIAQLFDLCRKQHDYLHNIYLHKVLEIDSNIDNCCDIKERKKTKIETDHYTLNFLNNAGLSAFITQYFAQVFDLWTEIKLQMSSLSAHAHATLQIKGQHKTVPPMYPTSH